MRTELFYRELKAHLDAFTKEVYGDSVEPLNCSDFIYNSIKDYTDKHKEDFLSHYPKPEEYPEIAKNYIRNLAEGESLTGRYHVFRGVLNNASIGPSLVKLVEYELDLAVKTGEFTEEERKEWMESYRKDLKQAG